MIEILKGGMYTTVQDYPGRVGYWNVGIPPSGPMDSYAFRLGNRIVGNAGNAAGLEITFMGPTVRFRSDTVIALTGAELEAELDGRQVPWWESFPVPAGSVLTLGKVKGNGCRTYLSVRGGIDVPEYLGSRSTFPMGRFGGLEGRQLKDGDGLMLNPNGTGTRTWKVNRRKIPEYGTEWQIDAVVGPYAAPDYFTEEDVKMFFGTGWIVHYNSNRLGIRLNGPSPQFARKDGGEGGRHPSNVHDYTYAVGTVNFTGNMPIVITADGPSLGGFISMATVIQSDLWKIGQVKAGDTVRFMRTDMKHADRKFARQERLLNP